jgi:hypothetical protein
VGERISPRTLPGESLGFERHEEEEKKSFVEVIGQGV